MSQELYDRMARQVTRHTTKRVSTPRLNASTTIAHSGGLGKSPRSKTTTTASSNAPASRKQPAPPTRQGAELPIFSGKTPSNLERTLGYGFAFQSNAKSSVGRRVAVVTRASSKTPNGSSGRTELHTTSSPAPIPTCPDRDSSPSSSAPAGVPKIDYSKMSRSELVGRIEPLVHTNLELRGMYEDLKAKYGDLREQNLALSKGVVALRKKSDKQRRRLKKFESLEAASMGRALAVGGEGEVGDEEEGEEGRELGGARRSASAGFEGMNTPRVGHLDDDTAMRFEDDTSASASVGAGAQSLSLAEAEAQRFPARATPPRTPTPPSQACGSINPFDDPPCHPANDLAFDIEQADDRMPRPLRATASPDGFAHEESLAISGWEGAYDVEQEEPMEAEQEDTRHQAALSDHPESRKSLRREDSMLSLSDIIDCSTFESPSPSDELGDKLRGQESGVGAQVKSSSSGAEQESEELKLKLHEAELTSRLSKEELDLVSRCVGASPRRPSAGADFGIPSTQPPPRRARVAHPSAHSRVLREERARAVGRLARVGSQGGAQVGSGGV